MTEIEFAKTFLGEFSVSGDEIKPLYCPFCQGGTHRDKYTFALNQENHTYNCKRGSCGQQGHFSALCRHFGVEADLTPIQSKSVVKKRYTMPQTVIETAKDYVLDYIKLRGITEDTAKVFGVGDDGSGNIVFPFYRNAEQFKNAQPTFVKFRPSRKTQKGERKSWREKDTEPILMGLHLCRPNLGTLYITEGEFDALALYQATGGAINVVSVPSGAEDFSWIETCADEIAQYDIIAVIGDNDEAGRRMAEEIEKKLPEKIVLFPDYELYRGCKDANEILLKYGVEPFVDILRSLKARPVEGLLNLSEVRSVDFSQIPRTLSCYKTLDKVVGGFLEGDLTVWTGKRGEGKSTFLNVIALRSIDQDKNVCIYSGEIPADRLKYQLSVCAAGQNNVDVIQDAGTGREVSRVQRDKQKLIEAWMNGRIWLYDNRIVTTDETDSIINAFTSAYRRYNCRVFIVDNLMTVALGGKVGDVLQLQSDFVIRLRKFAEKYGVHVHVVVHPRKVKGEIDDSDEVGGLGTITNIACNVLSVSRCSEAEAQSIQADTVVRCLKSRQTGSRGDVKFRFNPKDKRFWEPYSDSDARFGWERSEAQ